MPPLRYSKLSLCVPTFNRGKFIGRTLESIISQATGDVEIVVSDNASADETEEVVAGYKERFPRLTYFRWPKNMGADRNFLKVVELATGEYCWFMGSDDVAEPGAIAEILRALSQYDDLTGMSLNRYAYSSDLSKRCKERPVASGLLPRDRLLATVEDSVGLLGEYFGYISGQVVHAARWRQVVAESNLEPYFNAYVHVYVIAKMLKAHPRWLYLAKPCVGWRSGNDSFLADGMLRRLSLDVVGYEHIAGDLFRESHHQLYRNWNKTVATVHVRYHIGSAKFGRPPPRFFWEAFKLSSRYYWSYPAFWLITFPWLLVPSWFLKGLRALYRATFKKWRNSELKVEALC